MAERDPILDESAIPDPGDITPPHGDEVVNELRNASRHLPERSDDPDTDRPGK